MKNNLTILIDGGFLLMSRIFAFEKGFAAENSNFQKSMAAEQFKETLSQTLAKLANLFPGADNMVLMSEGGSWRKNLPVPQQLEDITYKGHREKKVELDWKAIYKAYNEFVHNCESAGITCSQHSAIEGDDWAWYWSRRLNAEGVNCVIWTSDCDLKQLVQTDGCAFTAWYNDKAGLVLPNSCAWPDDPMEAMMNPPFQSPALEMLTRRFKKCSYINPDMIVINKVLCGDAGDNIKSVIRYKKGTRTYRFAESDYKKFIEANGIDNLEDFRNNFDVWAECLANSPKYLPYGIKSEDVREMLDYNLKLVWLNEVVLPDTVTSSMVQFDYYIFDVNELKRNSRMLAGSNDDVANIFDAI
jgi:5'-3' exonuclease